MRSVRLATSEQVATEQMPPVKSSGGKKNNERLKFIIFSAIGVFNTLFDIVLYFVLFNLTKSILFANIISTSAALLGSYLLNSKLTFKSKKWNAKSFIGFVVVTLFGLWVLQTAVIYGIAHVITSLRPSYWQHLGSFEHLAKTIIPKLLATVVTFAWNFVWYNKVIFKDRSVPEQVITALDEL
jgi:putative flippase GtrA